VTATGDQEGESRAPDTPESAHPAQYHIVVGVDGSASSRAALEWALREAEGKKADVTAIFAWQVPFLSFPGAFDRDQLEKAAKDYLIEVTSEVAPSPKVPLWTIVAEGEPTESLIVASNDADLLVLGTRGRSRFMGLLLGSVSQGAAAHAACPVVLVNTSGTTSSGRRGDPKEPPPPLS
jgi:nucleotide-binding universal stress UspA family protein